MATSVIDAQNPDSQVSSLLKNILAFKHNPSGIQRVRLQHFRDVSGGLIDVVDATNPFMMLMESGSVNTAAFMSEAEANLRKQYPSLAQTPEDLYLHMSDKDYVDRFASPATTKFQMILDMAELQRRMVLDPQTGIRKITIPRNTEFIVADTVFSLQYPIDIKEMRHGGLQVVYDTTVESPLQALTTNVVEWAPRVLSVNQQEFLWIEFDTTQFTISTSYGDLNAITGYNKLLSFADQFYFARVYWKSNATGSQYREFLTTHTDQVYDPETPTAVLKVINGQLQVTIPQIYFTTNQVSGGIRVDIYQTKGEVNLSMENYLMAAFTTRWLAIDPADATPEVAAMQAMETFQAYSRATVVGGKNALPFEDLRDRVIFNTTGKQNLPITNVQADAMLENQSFELVKNIDVVTNRSFLATRTMPRPVDERLITAAAASIETLVVSMDEAIKHPSVRNNGTRITLTPEVLYQNTNGVIRMVDAANLQQLLQQPVDVVAANVTSGKYLYTPFHYVLDVQQGDFAVRPYYLNHPRAITCLFESTNGTTMLQVNTYRFALSKIPSGYRLLVETKGNTAYRELDDSQVHAHLSFTAQGEENRCYVLGSVYETLPTGERVFEFLLTTNYDVDAADNILLRSFMMLSNTPRSFACPLRNVFDIHYSTSAQMGNQWEPDLVDTYLAKFLLPNRIAGITHETIELEMGVRLKNLWASARSIPASAPFQVHDMDVNQVYEEDVFNVDPATGSIFTIDSAGELVYNVIHKKGETMFDPSGNPVLKYQRGQVKLDGNGLPIPIGPNLVQRQLDIVFIEGAYYFATDTASATYRETIVATMVDWITNKLSSIQKSTLEKTEVYFYPKTTMGSIRVMVDNGSISFVDAGQYFNVKLYVSDAVHDNASLREKITASTIRTLDAQLKLSTVAISTITTALEKIYRDDVIGFSVSGLGGSRNLQMLSVMDEGDRCSIRKRLTALPDGKLIVQEDVVVDFIKHSERT